MHEVFVPLQVLCEEGEVETLCVDTGALVVARAGCDVCLDTKNGFDTRFLALLVKLNRSVHVAVISEADCVHSVLFGKRDHLIDLR